MSEWLVALAAVGWLAAFIFGALWWGLHQRMSLLELLDTTGNPWTGNGRKASKVEGSGGDIMEQAARDLREQEINQLVDHLGRQAKRQGRSVSDEKLRDEARRMLRELDGQSGGGW